MECDRCGKSTTHLPYSCNRCGESFCSEHRLPESHDCVGLAVEKLERQSGTVKDDRSWFAEKFQNLKKRSDQGDTSSQKRNDSRRNQINKKRQTEHTNSRGGPPGTDSSPDVNPDGSLHRSRTHAGSRNRKPSRGRRLQNLKRNVKVKTYYYRVRAKSAFWTWLKVAIVVMLGAGLVFGAQAVMADTGPLSDVGFLQPHEERLDETKIEEQFLAHLNEERSKRGLQTLSQRDTLRELGESHTEDMVEHEYFDHVNSEGQTIEERYRQNGLLPECEMPIGDGSYYPGAENLAKATIHDNVQVSYRENPVSIYSESDIAEHLFRGWMHSDGHREAMLVYSASEAGLGLTITDDGDVYTALLLC